MTVVHWRPVVHLLLAWSSLLSMLLHLSIGQRQLDRRWCRRDQSLRQLVKFFPLPLQLFWTPCAFPDWRSRALISISAFCHFRSACGFACGRGSEWDLETFGNTLSNGSLLNLKNLVEDQSLQFFEPNFLLPMISRFLWHYLCASEPMEASASHHHLVRCKAHREFHTTASRDTPPCRTASALVFCTSR